MWKRKPTPAPDQSENMEQIQALQSQVAALRSHVQSVEAELQSKTEALKILNSAARNATVVIDWKTMGAFSIERMSKNDDIYTTIGYYLNTIDDGGKKKTVIKEWYLYCSEEQHEKLCKEFQAYIKR